MNIIRKAYRTFMPEILSPGTGLSIPTNKSVVPSNNVVTIQDVLDGRRYKLPGGGGDWSSKRGEDTAQGFKETGDQYRRQDRDLDILRRMTDPSGQKGERWEVKVPGGSRMFLSIGLANHYCKKLKEKGVPIQWISKVRTAQVNAVDHSEIVSSSMEKTFMVESLNVREGVKLNGAAFCVAPNYFISCAHVVRHYNKYAKRTLDISQLSGIITVSLIHGNRKYPAEVVAMDAVSDLALFRSQISVEPFAIDESVEVGEEILTVGSPHGFENNVSFGTIGSLNRKIYTYPQAPQYMFIDASVFTGNSGGPIVKTSNGAVTGMITAIVAASGEYGLNAGLPASYIKNFCIMNEISIVE